MRTPFVWPSCVTELWPRLELPVYLLVVTADEATARFAMTCGRGFRPATIEDLDAISAPACGTDS